MRNFCNLVAGIPIAQRIKIIQERMSVSTILIIIGFLGVYLLLFRPTSRGKEIDLRKLKSGSKRQRQIEKVEFGDRSFFHEYTYKPNTKLAEDLIIFTEVSTHAQLKILAGKKLKSSELEFSIPKGYETGDQEFDENFIVSCDNQLIKKEIFGNASVRQAIKNAMLSEASKITLIEGLLKFTIPVSHFRENKDLENGELIYKALTKISDALPHELSYLKPVSVGPSYSAKDVAQASPLILVLLAAVLWQFITPAFEHIDFNSMLLSSFSLTLPLSILYLIFCTHALKNAPALKKGYSVIIITSITAIPVIVLSFLIFINGFFDDAKPLARQAKIVNKKMTGRSHDKFQITARVQTSPIIDKTIYLTRLKFKQVEEGATRITIFEKPGFLGYPWIESTELKTKE